MDGAGVGRVLFKCYLSYSKRSERLWFIPLNKNSMKRLTGNNGVNNSMSSNKQQLNSIYFFKNACFFYIHPEYFSLLY